MKYTAEMDSGAMIYIAKFYKYWYKHSKVDGGILGHTDSTEITLGKSANQ
jgi:hypothetical protein